MLEVLLPLAALAVAIETVTEIVSKRAIEPILLYLFKEKAKGVVKAFAPALAFLLGLAAAFSWSLDAFGEYSGGNPEFGYLLTGVVLGGGSNYIHNLFRKPKHGELGVEIIGEIENS